jgi:hypothetical protein
VWEKVFASLSAAPDNEYLMLDSSLIRAHQQAATGKGGPKPGPFTPGVESRQNPDPFQAGRRKSAGLSVNAYPAVAGPQDL